MFGNASLKYFNFHSNIIKIFLIHFNKITGSIKLRLEHVVSRFVDIAPGTTTDRGNIR